LFSRYVFFFTIKSSVFFFRFPSPGSWIVLFKMISLCIDQYRYVFAVRKLVPVRYHFLMICVVVLVPVMEIILDSLLCRAPSSLVYRIYLPYQYISYFVSIPAYSFMIPVPVPVYVCPPLSCLSVR